ncbi:18977_t:CDS:1, partial [Racocetra persica]
MFSSLDGGNCQPVNNRNDYVYEGFTTKSESHFPEKNIIPTKLVSIITNSG